MTHLRLPEVIAEPHRYLSRIEARPAGSLAPLVVPFSRWELDFDEFRTPRVELKVDTPTPLDLATLTGQDPRSSCRLRLWVGHRIDGLDDRILVANLGLRLNQSTDPEMVSGLVAQGNEALMLDTAPSTGTLSGASIPITVAALITANVPGAVVNTAAGLPASGAVSIPPPNYTDKWNSIDDLLDRLGDVDVFDDGLGVWWIQARPQVAAAARWTFRQGVGGARISQSTQLSREPWANRVLLEHRWTPTASTEQVITSVRSVTTGPWAATVGNVKTEHIIRTTPISQSGCDAAATSLVRRFSSRGRSFTIRHVALPWLRPGMTVGVESAPGVIARHIVSTTSFDSDGLGVTQTRYPDNATIGA